VFLLLDFVVESFDFRLMQVFELILILPMLSSEIVLHIFALGLDEIQFVSFLFF
jgi:hypothetical protein